MGLLWGLNELIDVKHLEQHQAPSKCSMNIRSVQQYLKTLFEDVQKVENYYFPSRDPPRDCKGTYTDTQAETSSDFIFFLNLSFLSPLKHSGHPVVLGPQIREGQKGNTIRPAVIWAPAYWQHQI